MVRDTETAPLPSQKPESEQVTQLSRISVYVDKGRVRVASYLVTALETVLALTTDPSSSDSVGSGGRKYITKKVMRACNISMDTMLLLPRRRMCHVVQHSNGSHSAG